MNIVNVLEPIKVCSGGKCFKFSDTVLCVIPRLGQNFSKLKSKHETAASTLLSIMSGKENLNYTTSKIFRRKKIITHFLFWPPVQIMLVFEQSLRRGLLDFWRRMKIKMAAVT